MSEANKALAKQLFEGIGAGNFAVIDSLIVDNFVEHEELPPDMPAGKEGVKALFSMLRGAFPDLQVAIDHMVAEGDLVSAFVVFKGTHKGDFMGIPATGKPVSINVSDLLRFQNGKIVEHWGIMDNAGLMQQLGIGGAP
ncbi:MAG TPA: ester cyclase [Dehalococcoidia bacterium]|nr:ester cyclase [Dehalococcoidia bacterium]